MPRQSKIMSLFIQRIHADIMQASCGKTWKHWMANYGNTFNGAWTIANIPKFRRVNIHHQVLK